MLTHDMSICSDFCGPSQPILHRPTGPPPAHAAAPPAHAVFGVHALFAQWSQLVWTPGKNSTRGQGKIKSDKLQCAL